MGSLDAAADVRARSNVGGVSIEALACYALHLYFMPWRPSYQPGMVGKRRA